MRYKRLLLSAGVILTPLLLLTVLIIAGGYLPIFGGSPQSSVLGTLAQVIPAVAASPTPLPTATIVPSPTAVPYTITIVDAPEELMEGDIATFTWSVGGPSVAIPTSTIYYGTKSTPGILTRNADPESTGYTRAINDFLEGRYIVPIRFVANIPHVSPGNYYFRGYALINGKHYWTDELTFTVKKTPRHEAKIIDYPKSIPHGETASFTWEISGPAAETGFTAIVAGKESKPGSLDNSVAMTATSYSVIVNDFTHSATKVPLRFIGNASLLESGTYYFRALAFINDKNIWSEEQTFTVQ